MTSKRRTIWQIAFCFWLASTLTSMAGMSIGGVVFMGASFLFLFLDREERLGLGIIRGLWLPAATLALLGWCVVSVFFAWIWPPLGIPLDNAWELRKFHYFLYPFAVALVLLGTAAHRPLTQHPMWRTLEIAVVLVSLVTIAQFWGRYLFPETWLTHRFFREITSTRNFHGQGIMMFHLSFASALCFSVAYFVARLIWNGGGNKIGLFVTPVVASVAVFYTYSRIAWVALAAVFVTLGFLRKPRWGWTALGGVIVLLATLWSFDQSFRERVDYSVFSLRGRVIVWNAAWEMVKDRPLTGVGHGKTGTYSEAYATKVYGQEQWFASHAHNNFLEILASTGAIGLLTFLFWWGLLFFYAIKNFQRASADEKWLSAGTIAALVAFHVNGITQVNFYDGKSQHSLMLCAGIILAQYLSFGRKQGAISTVHHSG